MGGSTRSTASKGASQGTAGRMSCCFPAVCREPLPKVGLLSPPRPAEHLLLLHLLSHPLQAPQCHRWVEGPFFPRAAAFSPSSVVGTGKMLPHRSPSCCQGDPQPGSRPTLCLSSDEPMAKLPRPRGGRRAELWPLPHTTALTCRTSFFQAANIQRKAPAVGGHQSGETVSLLRLL